MHAMGQESTVYFHGLALALDSANRWKWDAFLIISSFPFWAVSRSKTSHLGRKTSKFDTWNSAISGSNAENYMYMSFDIGG